MASLVDAILAYCADVGADPMATLDESFAVLVALTRTDILVADGTAPAQSLEDRHRIGEVVGPATITGRIRVLRDSEVWRGVLADGTRVVVKVVDDEDHGPGLVSRELAALARLDGSVAPRLLWHERSSTGGTIVLDEVDGDPADLAALVADVDGRRRIAVAVLDAYVALHERGVLHGDVHPGNVLVGRDSTVTLIDFGLAGTASEPPPRPGGGEYLDPASAAALRAGTPTPALDASAEQFAVAAVAQTDPVTSSAARASARSGALVRGSTGAPTSASRSARTERYRRCGSVDSARRSTRSPVGQGVAPTATKGRGRSCAIRRRASSRSHARSSGAAPVSSR